MLLTVGLLDQAPETPEGVLCRSWRRDYHGLAIMTCIIASWRGCMLPMSWVSELSWSGGRSESSRWYRAGRRRCSPLAWSDGSLGAPVFVSPRLGMPRSPKEAVPRIRTLRQLLA